MNEQEIRKIVLEILDEDSRNIHRELKRRALLDTCDFIETHMPLVNSIFQDRFELLEYALTQAHLDGLWLEFGIYRGCTAQFIAARGQKTIYGFDSFQGNPEDWRSEYLKGSFALDEVPQFPDSIQIIQGYFQETLPGFLELHPAPAAFVHIDCDLYASTKTIFNCLKERICSGTVIVFDEFFNYPGWKDHEYRAFQEFIAETGKPFRYLGYVYKHSQVAIQFT
jgi:hypothetical protein